MSIKIDFENMYRRQFGTMPKVDGSYVLQLNNQASSLTSNYLGQEVWLPVTFFELDVKRFGVSELMLPHAVISITGRKNIIKTPLAERTGTVKELFSIEDYIITIKGFLIGYDSTKKYPIFPEKELELLNKLWITNEAIKLDNALTNIFIGKEHKVVIEDLKIPEVEGGKKHIRPFSMNLESDTVFELELK